VDAPQIAVIDLLKPLGPEFSLEGKGAMEDDSDVLFTYLSLAPTRLGAGAYAARDWPDHPAHDSVFERGSGMKHTITGATMKRRLIGVILDPGQHRATPVYQDAPGPGQMNPPQRVEPDNWRAHLKLYPQPSGTAWTVRHIEALKQARRRASRPSVIRWRNNA
jgi:hypothetical protein